MISWYRVNENCWEFRIEMYPLECNDLREVVICSLEAGLSWKEMKIACEEMDKHNHNYCEFGINGKFVYSERI